MLFFVWDAVPREKGGGLAVEPDLARVQPEGTRWRWTALGRSGLAEHCVGAMICAQRVLYGSAVSQLPRGEA